VLLSTTDPRGNIGIDPNMTNQSNQFFVGLSARSAELSLDGSFVYKSDDNIIGVTDTNSVFAPAAFVIPSTA
jgi:hypothetical protein